MNNYELYETMNGKISIYEIQNGYIVRGVPEMQYAEDGTFAADMCGLLAGLGIESWNGLYEDPDDLLECYADDKEMSQLIAEIIDGKLEIYINAMGEAGRSYLGIVE